MDDNRFVYAPSYFTQDNMMLQVCGNCGAAVHTPYIARHDEDHLFRMKIAEATMTNYELIKVMKRILFGE